MWDLEKWETGWLTQLTQLTPQGSPKVGMVDEWYGGCGRWLFGGFGGGETLKSGRGIKKEARRGGFECDGTPQKTNGWNLKITPLFKGKSSEPNLDFGGFKMLGFLCFRQFVENRKQNPWWFFRTVFRWEIFPG